MADFLKAFAKTMAMEGAVLETVSGDAGGETYCGIARASNPTWQGWELIDMARGLPGFPGILYRNQVLQGLVAQVFHERYWGVIKGDAISSQDIAEKVYDIAVNMGPSRAVTFLQRAVNVLNYDPTTRSCFCPDVTVNGQIDNALQLLNTLAGHEDDERHLLHYLQALQESRYLEICEARTSQRKFARGWDKRGRYLPDDGK